MFNVEECAARRVEMAGDPYRPAFHFIAPYGWMNDPNGTVYWKGRWHLFYQCVPEMLAGGPALACWGHAVSDDFVHWKDLPLALVPEPGTYDEKGCWSGTSWVEEDRVIASYHAHQGGLSMATASDEMLVEWTKHPANPVVPFDPAKTYDPCIWGEDGVYYAICGRITGAKYGDGRDQEFGGKDIAYLYKSSDLAHWEYAGPLYEGGVFTNPGEDCACPDFFPLGNKHMLLFLSHNQGMQYYIGSYADERFVPEIHGRMNFTNPTLPKFGFAGDIAAPISWKGPNGRRTVIGWVTEGRAMETLKDVGWAGLLSLPRDVSLGDDGTLRMEPIPELQSLRRDHRSVSSLALDGNEPVLLDGIEGDALEIRASFDSGSSDRVGLTVRRSPDGAEETVISYDRRAGTLTIDPSRASVSPEMVGREAQVAPLQLGAGEPLDLAVFVDRSIVEVFANGRQCVTKRIYPSRPDSLGVQVFSQGGEAVLRSLDAWRMESIWPMR